MVECDVPSDIEECDDCWVLNLQSKERQIVIVLCNDHTNRRVTFEPL